jgi:hypothetical protein
MLDSPTQPSKPPEPSPDAPKSRARPTPKAKPQDEVEVDIDATEVKSAKQARKPPPKARDESQVVVDAVAPSLIPEVVEDEVDDVFVEEDGRGVRAGGGEDGKLVKDILAAAQQMGSGPKGDYRGDSDRFKQETEIAKGLLQHLARSAQPLDTLIQFSQEDLGNMENEFKRWTSECDRQQRALEQEKAQTEQQHQELNNKLEELNKEIERQQSKLRMMKAAAFLKEFELMKQFAALCT